MVDVRSLLRSELASRGATSSTPNSGTRITKKRRLEVDDDVVHKKSRGDVPTLKQLSPREEMASPPPSAEGVPAGRDEEQNKKIEYPIGEEETEPGHSPEDVDRVEDNAPAESERQAASLISADNVQTQAIDEDEWAAFEREVVAPTRIPHVPVATMVAATILAAPVSAREIAAQQRKEREELAKAREADMEGEKEDAARLLEEEFDEMEQLEERVRRLKERHEELRKRTRVDSQHLDAIPDPKILVSADVKRQYEEGSESDEEDDDWDDWRFR